MAIGPVFPIVNKRINPSDGGKFTPEMISLNIRKTAQTRNHKRCRERNAQQICSNVTDWSHQIGSAIIGH